MTKHLSEVWKKPKENLGELWKERLVQYRKGPTVVRKKKPTRPDKARRYGYKAKKGFSVARVRVRKGKRKRPKPSGGRRPKRMGRFFTPGKSKQQIAEEKASKKYPNMEVLGSYYLIEDGNYKWFEVVMADRDSPTVKKDKDRKWITKSTQKGRAERGKTPAGKKSRGLRKKGKGTEKK